MKKLFFASLIACLFLSLTACDSVGGQDPSDNPFVGTWNYYDNGITVYEFEKDGTVTAYRDGEEIGEGTYLWDSEGFGKLIADGKSISLYAGDNSIKVLDTYAVADPLMRSPAALKKNSFAGTYYYNYYGDIGVLELAKDGSYTYSYTDGFISTGVYAIDGDSVIFMSEETASAVKGGIDLNGMFWSTTAPTGLDILAGTWVHSTEPENIMFDGVGEFCMYNSWSYEDGTYDFDGENLELHSLSRELTGYIDEDGDLVFDDLIGFFTRESGQSMEDDEEYYTADGGFDTVEYGIIAYGWGRSQEEYIQNGDHTITYSDYDLGLRVTYPDDMYILNGYLDGALLVDGGEYGVISGCDVTDWYNDFDGDNINFVEKYIWAYVIDDFEAMYDQYDNYDDDVTLIKEKNADYLAAAEINIWNIWFDISAKTYIYEDINGRIIAKTIYVDYGDDDSAKQLYKLVGDIVTCDKPVYLSSAVGEWNLMGGDGTVSVEGDGYFIFTNEEETIEGYWETDGNGVYIELDGAVLRGYVDEAGDVVLKGFDGWFNRSQSGSTIAGIWVNPYDGGFVVFDKFSTFVLVTQDEIIIGGYTHAQGSIYIYIDGESALLDIDEDGDMIIENQDGYFTHVTWVEDGGLDGLAGVWTYYEGTMLMLLDGEGAYELYAEGEFREGSYEVDGSEIFLYSDEDEEIIETGCIDEDGNIQFENLDGGFRRMDLGSPAFDDDAVGFIPAAFTV